MLSVKTTQAARNPCFIKCLSESHQLGIVEIFKPYGGKYCERGGARRSKMRREPGAASNHSGDLSLKSVAEPDGYAGASGKAGSIDASVIYLEPQVRIVPHCDYRV